MFFDGGRVKCHNFVKKVFGVDKYQSKYVNTEEFLKIMDTKNFLKTIDKVCVVQDCNMGGAYLRNHYVVDSNVYWFVTLGTDFWEKTVFPKKITKTEVEDFVWTVTF